MLLLHDVDALVAEHRGWLLRLCERRLGGDRHLAEDVVQETFVKLSRALGRGEHIANVRGWLRTVAQHGTVDELRRSRSVLVDELPDTVTHDTFAADGDPELEVAWKGLSPRHREVLRLRELEGLRYDEIATAMATGVPAVETLLFRARAALRREYSRASSAITISAPAQIAVGPLRPSRWQSMWRSSGLATRAAEAKLVAFVERVQATLAAGTDHVTELAGGLAVGGIAVASLLSPTVPDVPAVPPVPAVSTPAVTAPEVPTTVPTVPPAPAVPTTATPEPPVTVTVPPVVDDVAEPIVETALDPVLEVVEPVLGIFSD